VVTRKFRPPLGEAQSTALLEALCDFEVVTTERTLVLDAHLRSRRELLSWFDALIAEGPIRSRCDVLFSEDFHHDGRIGDLQLVTPLR
jgi:predicted nucleic acid-binding protein